MSLAMAAEQKQKRAFTLRALVVSLVALLLMGIWIEYVERFCWYGGPLGENFPPNAAVGTVLAVMGISVLLGFLRKGLRLAPAELVVVYAALVLAAPLMTQGMWGRLFGLLAGIPHSQDFKSYESLPSMLWPHGANLVKNGRFTQGLDTFTPIGGGVITWTNVDRKAKGVWKSPVLSNGGDTNARTSLTFTLNRQAQGKEVLIPGERFLFSMLVMAEALQKDSFYFVELHADDAPARSIFMSASATRPTFANPCGFQRVGASPVAIPVELQSNLTFRVGLEGEGLLTLQDIEFFNVEAIEGLYAGRKMVTESGLAKLDAHERDFTVIKPDNMFSWRGLKFLVTGYIPLAQWTAPALAWTALIGGLFIGFLGLNLLMRKQWSEHERFSFPQTILPRN
ncbi:MAG: hypothetical protein HYV36_05475, partial [Lentisphaerae bacterium]|nr:hypothetical protein [Lentisphaerota bacterium]